MTRYWEDALTPEEYLRCFEEGVLAAALGAFDTRNPYQKGTGTYQSAAEYGRNFAWENGFWSRSRGHGFLDAIDGVTREQALRG